MKVCAIAHKEQAKLLFCDDKAKVTFGNPGALLSTGVKVNKMTFILLNGTA